MRLLVGTLDNYKLDSKGRLSIPTKWRERLGKEFYMVAVTVKGCHCLTLYPTDVFNEMVDKIQVGTENEKYAITKELFRRSEEATLDAQGRFTVNQRLKKMCGLENETEIVFEGNGNSIEVWNLEEFDKMQSTFDESLGFYDLMDKANASKED